MSRKISGSSQFKSAINFSFFKFSKLPLALILFYLVYLSKSALGINISSKHSAPKVLKLPLMTLDCVLPIAGNYCYKVSVTKLRNSSKNSQ